MKSLLVNIGFGNEFIIEPQDAIRLLEIATRCVRVKQKNWTGPYFASEDQEPFVTRAELVDYESPPPPQQESFVEDSIHLKATRDLT